MKAFSILVNVTVMCEMGGGTKTSTVGGGGGGGGMMFFIHNIVQSLPRCFVRRTQKRAGWLIRPSCLLWPSRSWAMT